MASQEERLTEGSQNHGSVGSGSSGGVHNPGFGDVATTYLDQSRRDLNGLSDQPDEQSKVAEHNERNEHKSPAKKSAAPSESSLSGNSIVSLGGLKLTSTALSNSVTAFQSMAPRSELAPVTLDSVDSSLQNSMESMPVKDGATLLDNPMGSLPIVSTIGDDDEPPRPKLDVLRESMPSTPQRSRSGIVQQPRAVNLISESPVKERPISVIRSAASSVSGPTRVDPALDSESDTGMVGVSVLDSDSESELQATNSRDPRRSGMPSKGSSATASKLQGTLSQDKLNASSGERHLRSGSDHDERRQSNKPLQLSGRQSATESKIIATSEMSPIEMYAVDRRQSVVDGSRVTGAGLGAEIPSSRPRTGSVASKIGAYNMKFREDEGPPGRRRGGSISKSRRESVAGGAAIPPMVMAETINETLKEEAVDHAEVQHRLKSKTIRTEALKRADSEERSGSLRKYMSHRSLRSLRSANAIEGRPQPADDNDQEETGNWERQPLKKKKRLKIENERAKMSLWSLAVYGWRKRLNFILREYEQGVFRIWADSLKFIEGRFGTGVASYFVLSRSLLIMNWTLALIWIAVVLGVGVFSMGDPYTNELGVRTGTKWADEFNSRFNFSSTVGLNFFAATGVWQYTPMFYCSYRPIMMGIYRMDLAYVFGILAMIVVSFIIIIRRIRGEYVRKAGFSTGIGYDEVYPFSAVVFGSWNHAVESDTVKQNQMNAICTVLKTLISRRELEGKIVPKTTCEKAMMFLRRAFTNILSLGLLGGSGYVIFDSVQGCTSLTNTFLYNIQDVFAKTVSPEGHCTSPNMLTPFPPYLVSLFNTILPSLFAKIATFEMYADPQWETRATLARSYLIKIASIYLMLFSMSSVVLDKNNANLCWEHEIAKRFFNLQWLDISMACVSTIISSALTKQIWGVYEFDITSHILDLVYRQAIIWIGSIYAPVMSIFSILGSVIVFNVQRWTVTQFAQPPKRIYNSYSQVIWFLIFMLLTLVLMALPILFAVYSVMPSSTCGPYRRPFPGSTLTYTQGEGAFTVIPKSIQAMTDEIARSILSLIGSIVVIGPLLAALGLWVYALLAVAQKRTQRLTDLEKEVKEEREDKKNLIRHYGVQM